MLKQHNLHILECDAIPRFKLKQCLPVKSRLFKPVALRTLQGILVGESSLVAGCCLQTLVIDQAGRCPVLPNLVQEILWVLWQLKYEQAKMYKISLKIESHEQM